METEALVSALGAKAWYGTVLLHSLPVSKFLWSRPFMLVYTRPASTMLTANQGNRFFASEEVKEKHERSKSRSQHQSKRCNVELFKKCCPGCTSEGCRKLLMIRIHSRMLRWLLA